MSSPVNESHIPKLVADLDAQHVTMRKAKTAPTRPPFSLDDNSHITVRKSKKTHTHPTFFLDLELGDIDNETRPLTQAPGISKPSGSQDGGPNCANNGHPKCRYRSATISSKAKVRVTKDQIHHRRKDRITANSSSNDIQSSKKTKRKQSGRTSKSKEVSKGDDSDCKDQSHTPNRKERSWSSTCQGRKTKRSSTILCKSRAYKSKICTKPIYINEDTPENYAHMSAETFKKKHQKLKRKGTTRNIRQIAILNNCLNMYRKINEQ